MKKAFFIILLTSGISWAMQEGSGLPRQIRYAPYQPYQPRPYRQRTDTPVSEATLVNLSGSSSSSTSRQPRQYYTYTAPSLASLSSTTSYRRQQQQESSTSAAPTESASQTSPSNLRILPPDLEQLIRPLNTQGQELIKKIWNERLSRWQQEQILEQLKILYSKLKSKGSSNEDIRLILLKKLNMLINEILWPNQEGILTLNLTRLHRADTLFEIDEVGETTHTLVLTQDQDTEPFSITLDILVLSNRLPNIRTLRLKNLSLNPQKLHTILQAFPNVVSLSITGTPLTPDLLNTLANSPLAQNISKLDLTGAGVTRDEQFEDIAYKFPKLQTLKLL